MNLDNQPFFKVKKTSEVKTVESIIYKDGFIYSISSNSEVYLYNEIEMIYKDMKIYKDINEEEIIKYNDILNKNFNGFFFKYFDGFYIQGVVLQNGKGAVLNNVDSINKNIEDLENIGLKVSKFYCNNLQSFYITLDK